MAKYSTRSWMRLQSCHKDIVRLFVEVIKVFDVTILCGHRGEAAQTLAYPKYTRVQWANSKHNKTPSLAVDVMPYDNVKGRIVSWEDVESFALMAGYVLCTAKQLGIDVRWGHDWNRNLILSDEKGKLVDRPHFELV